MRAKCEVTAAGELCTQQCQWSGPVMTVPPHPTRILCCVHLIWWCMRSKNTQFMRGSSHPILICCSMINYSGSMRALKHLGSYSLKRKSSSPVVKNLPARGHRFDPWSWKIPHAVEQQSLCAKTTEPVLLELVLPNEKPRHSKEEWPLLSQLEKAHVQQWRPSTAVNK